VIVVTTDALYRKEMNVGPAIVKMRLGLWNVCVRALLDKATTSEKCFQVSMDDCSVIIPATGGDDPGSGTFRKDRCDEYKSMRATVVLAIIFGGCAATLLLAETTSLPKWRDGRAYGLAFGVLSAICGIICTAVSVDFSDGAEYSYGFALLTASWMLTIVGTLAFWFAFRFAAARSRTLAPTGTAGGPIYSQLGQETA